MVCFFWSDVNAAFCHHYMLPGCHKENHKIIVERLYWSYYQADDVIKKIIKLVKNIETPLELLPVS